MRHDDSGLRTFDLFLFAPARLKVARPLDNTEFAVAEIGGAFFPVSARLMSG